jgi:HD-GYP domain-containing protein (c-di-GMP phosphodiesterase class II)
LLTGILEVKLTKDKAEILKTIAVLFKKNRSIILETTKGLIKKNLLFTDNLENSILEAGLENLLDDLILSCESSDLESYYSLNKRLAEKLSAINISYKKYLTAFQIFQDSYLMVLNNILDRDNIIEFFKVLNTIHHKTFYIVSNKFFEVNDTTIMALAKLVELRDIETSEHLERTRKFAFLIARELNLNYTDTSKIYKVGPLHDIGKVGIKDSILLKEGKLTDNEFEEMKKHTIIGAEIIEKTFGRQRSSRHFYSTAMDIVRFHHEKYDGGGYPNGLAGEYIPLPARIFALVDAYDAIVSKRPYKEALPHMEAVERIVSDSEKHFDPGVVKAFVNIQGQFKKISSKQEIKK